MVSSDIPEAVSESGQAHGTYRSEAESPVHAHAKSAGSDASSGSEPPVDVMTANLHALGQSITCHALGQAASLLKLS